MNIAVIGTGYVGLSTGTCLADMGHRVFCVDIDEKKINNLKKNIIPIFEPGLKNLVEKNQDSGRLTFSLNAKMAIESCNVIICAVGTPEGKNGNVELKYVKEVAATFGRHLNNYKVFVNKSTVPVGTGKLCREIIQKELDKKNSSLKFDIVSNPEFLREGSAIKDTMNPDRIIIGTENPRSKKIMEKIYQKLTSKNVPILFTNLQSSETIKYAANCFLATKISFINELANFCDKTEGDIKTVAKGIGMDKRISPLFLNAGTGYGGSCFPKDVTGLINTGKKLGCEFKIISAADKVNDNQKLVLYKKLKKLFPDLSEKKIAIWGLAFKPGTDDMREAPSLAIIKKLQEKNTFITVFDPVATNTAKKEIKNKNISYANDLYQALKNADALLILTEWPQFLKPDYPKMKSIMNRPLILDGRNCLSKKQALKQGFEYYGIGV